VSPSGTKWVFTSQKTAFLVVTAVKTSNLTQSLVFIAEDVEWDIMPVCALWSRERSLGYAGN
jgi:hypothetical protein